MTNPVIFPLDVQFGGECNCANFTGGFHGVATKFPQGSPGSSTGEGEQGEWRCDGNYVYFCVATDTWKRVALETW